MCEKLKDELKEWVWFLNGCDAGDLLDANEVKQLGELVQGIIAKDDSEAA